MFSFPTPGQFYGPEQALATYKNLVCVTPDGPVTVSINIYRNANNKADQGGTQDAVRIKDSLFRVARPAIVLMGGNVPFVDVFLGKGAPQDIIAVLEMLVVYSPAYIKANAKAGNSPEGRCAALLADPKLSWKDTLQQICNQWIGLDCNGFVGNWLKLVLPESKLNQNSRANDVRAKAKATRRNLADIEYWDVMCYCKNEHIAAVNNRGSSPVSFQVCQSAGGGPRMNEYRFLKVTGDTFRLAAPTKDDIGGAFYVISLW